MSKYKVGDRVKIAFYGDEESEDRYDNEYLNLPSTVKSFDSTFIRVEFDEAVNGLKSILCYEEELEHITEEKEQIDN